MRTGVVYILLCSDGSYYTGVTNDLERRLQEHQAGKFKGYTSSRRPVTLTWNSDDLDIQDAISLEKQIKGWSRKKKEALMNSDDQALVALSVAYRDRKRLS